MKHVLKTFFAGLIWAVVLIAALIIFVIVKTKGGGEAVSAGTIISRIGALMSIKNIGRILISIIVVLPCGAIGYTLWKLWVEWFYSHFTVFGKDAVTGYIFSKFLFPLIFCVAGMFGGIFLLFKLGLFGALS